MRFPSDFPFSPPTFRFTPSIYHPNVYKDGRLCISILHRSGDVTSGEPDNETWVPTQTVETVLISIVSLLSDPNVSSPANIEAAVAYTKDRDHFDKVVREEVLLSRKSIPEEFKMMADSTAYVAPHVEEEPEEYPDDAFWYETDDSAEEFQADDDNDDNEDTGPSDDQDEVMQDTTAKRKDFQSADGESETTQTSRVSASPHA